MMTTTGNWNSGQYLGQLQGTQQWKYCPTCGMEFGESDWKYCPKCGTARSGSGNNWSSGWVYTSPLTTTCASGYLGGAQAYQNTPIVSHDNKLSSLGTATHSIVAMQ